MTEEIQYLTNLINNRIHTLNIEKPPANLYDPINYILGLGGKRLRPMLALLSHGLFSNDPNEALDPAIGIEVFHNFTLMHDDIMDGAPLRRGNPTVHKKWDHNIAILSGDVMLVNAYQLIMNVPDDKLRVILDSFNKCAQEVCEGQQIDMDFESEEEVDENEYIEMIRLKTAVLLGFSTELGAIIGGGSKAEIDSLKEYGENLGVGFQLKDDLLDVYGDHQKFGKQVGGDIIANKKTFLWIKAWERADRQTRDILKSWTKKEKFNPEDKVKEITGIYDSLDVKNESEKRMNTYFTRAMEILDDLNIQDGKKNLLKSFSKQLIARDF